MSLECHPNAPRILLDWASLRPLGSDVAGLDMSKGATNRDQVTNSRRKRREFRIDDDFKAKLAIERFSGDLPDVKELAGRYGRSRSVVSRAIMYALKNGLVRITRANHAKTVRARKLEREIHRRYRSCSPF